MSIEIYDDVLVPEVETQPRNTTRKYHSAIPATLKHSVQNYCNAYKIVYGMVPEVVFQDGFIRIKGHTDGVTKRRLKEMTNQLKWRHG